MIKITFAIIVSLFLVFKPRPFMKFMGDIYWHMFKYTALGKSEETKKYVFGENTYWFRTLGIIMLIMIGLSLVARLS
ncbi:MAG: hypothetical protein APR62_07885 [Smithella sp. SDB]|nr:MAG: hypothetical protein APR62_07885 [Smithella sp. SDB]